MVSDGYTTVFNYRTGKDEQVSRSGLITLADHIILRAVNDYKSPWHKHERHSIENFIKTPYFDLLSRSCVHPDKLITFLRQEVKQEE